jgi:hypothetical protein
VCHGEGLATDSGIYRKVIGAQAIGQYFLEAADHIGGAHAVERHCGRYRQASSGPIALSASISRGREVAKRSLYSTIDLALVLAAGGIDVAGSGSLPDQLLVADLEYCYQ